MMALAARQTAFSLVMRRDFARPREIVFAAWTDPAMVERWWPGRYTLLSSQMDVRPGGAWRRCLRRLDGVVLTEHGVFTEVSAPERLAFTYNCEGAEVVEAETLVVVTFADLAGGTRLTLHHGSFESDFRRLVHEDGWSRCLDRISTTVSKQ
jgi:uncharacterized protein YndB with AHSA1/START domain